MSISIGSITYGAAGTAFTVLSLLLLKGWRGRVQGVLLVSATACTAAWAYAVAFAAPAPLERMAAADVLEIARSALWFAFLIVLLGYSRSVVRSLRYAALAIGIFCAVLVVGALWGPGFQDQQAALATIVGRLVLAVIGMVLVEQLFRNVPAEQRWGIKFLCLGLGAAFACEFYLYADAMLFRRPDRDIWAARGAVYALIVPLLAVSAARNPRWSVDLAVSRRFVFHSTAILGASAYLVAMAGAGYLIRYIGGRWGAVLQVASFFGAMLLLFVVLFSGTLRARLKVYLSKNFFSYRYDYREEWLRFTRTLSEGEAGVALRERSIRAIANLVDSPAGALWIAADSGDYEPAAQWNMPRAVASETAGGALARFLRERHWVIDVDECSSHPEEYGGLALPAWLRDIPQAWLVVPLTLHDEVMGFVVLARSKAKLTLNWEVGDLLKTAAMQAASYLSQCEAARALVVARQFESFNRMSAFIVHDLKNVIAQLSLLLANAGKHRHNPQFQADMLETIGNSAEKMRRLLAQLRGAATFGPPAPLPLAELVARSVAAKQACTPCPQLLPGDPDLVVMGHGERLERVLGHLLQNAVEATPADGAVTVKAVRKGASALVEIRDTGCGMSPEFVQSRLFTPFESTKHTGMGVGTFEARQYLRELGGRIEVTTREGEGSVFRVYVPLLASRLAGDTAVPMEAGT